jgi:integrase/recombinase XerD
LGQAIQGFLLYKETEGLSRNTIRNYSHSLAMWLEWQADGELREVTSADLLGFLHYLRHDYRVTHLGPFPVEPCRLAPKTIRNVWSGLHSFYTWASKELGVEHLVREIPAPKASQPLIEPLTQEEIEAVLRSCQYSQPWNGLSSTQSLRPTRHRDKAIVLFLLDTGVRNSELRNVKRRDCDVKLGRARVFGKGAKERFVVFGVTCRRALWRYVADREQVGPGDWLFLTNERRQMTRANLWRLLKRIGDRAGVPSVYPHRFRHTFAITWIRSGGDLFTLQAMLGHTTLEMVKHYARVARSDLEAVHRRASPVDNWHLHV